MTKNVLICDDDQGILDVAKIVLHDKGYNVTTLNDSKHIDSKIKEIRPDVILIDLWMPEADGEQIVKKLKKNDETKNIPVVVVSARRDTPEAARKSGADGYLLKPFDIEQLEEIVEKHLHN